VYSLLAISIDSSSSLYSTTAQNMTTSVVTQAPEAPVCSQEVAQAEAVVPPREKSSGSDETQVETGSPETTEFKEGGYGWSVLLEPTPFSCQST